MKKILFFVFLLVAEVAMAQDYSFPVKFKGKAPSISDFVTALVNQEEAGELLGYIGREWENYQQGKPTQGKFTLKSSYGFVRYEETMENAGKDVTSITEFCYWNCRDGRHKVVALATNVYEDGVPAAWQFSGLTLYMYDRKTQRMEAVYNNDLGIEDLGVNSIIIYSLPDIGKNIIATANDPEKGECKFVYVWNGRRFNLQK